MGFIKIQKVQSLLAFRLYQLLLLFAAIEHGVKK